MILCYLTIYSLAHYHHNDKLRYNVDRYNDVIKRRHQGDFYHSIIDIIIAGKLSYFGLSINVYQHIAVIE